VNAKLTPLGALAVIALSLATLHNGLEGGLQANWPVVAFIIISTVTAFIIWFIPRERYQHIFASTFGWLPAVVGAVSWPFGTSTALSPFLAFPFLK
jgi:hypothetical protein